MTQVHSLTISISPSHVVPLKGADTMVECPLCQDIVGSFYINQHIDSGCKMVHFSPLVLNGRTKGNDAAAKAWDKMFSMSKPK